MLELPDTAAGVLTGSYLLTLLTDYMIVTIAHGIPVTGRVNDMTCAWHEARLMKQSCCRTSNNVTVPRPATGMHQRLTPALAPVLRPGVDEIHFVQRCTSPVHRETPVADEGACHPSVHDTVGAGSKPAPTHAALLRIDRLDQGCPAHTVPLLFSNTSGAALNDVSLDARRGTACRAPKRVPRLINPNLHPTFCVGNRCGSNSWISGGWYWQQPMWCSMRLSFSNRPPTCPRQAMHYPYITSCVTSSRWSCA